MYVYYVYTYIQVQNESFNHFHILKVICIIRAIGFESGQVDFGGHWPSILSA